MFAGTVVLLTALPGAAGPVDYIAPNYIAPILSTGLVGVFLLMIVFRYKIMPTYVHEDAKVEWERERATLQAATAELKMNGKDDNDVYTCQVIPTLTWVLGAELDLG